MGLWGTVLLRRILDGLYLLSGILSATAIVGIVVIVSLQVVFNLITKTGIGGLNLTIPSYADFAGYLLAAASFFGLSYTLVHGGHIRVSLVTGRLGPRIRFFFDVFALALGLLVSAGGAYYMVLLNMQSFQFGDMSSGIVAIPIWIVQLPVSAGLTILAIAFADLLVRTLRTGRMPLREPAGRE